MNTNSTAPSPGRNEPCPCGSGKKYKRCCGVGAAPKLSVASDDANPAGWDPEALKQMNPEMMGQVTSALKRLPKGQLQRLQTLFQQAMNGKDISAELAVFEKSLPPDLREMAQGWSSSLAAMNVLPALQGDPQKDEMSVEQAKEIIKQAVQAGELNEEKAQSLLEGMTSQEKVSVSGETPSKIGKFLKGLSFKKDREKS